MQPHFPIPIPADLEKKFLPGSIVTRFAPSPTGYLHHGHLLHMMYVFGISAKLKGKVVIRIEDHDRSRFRPEYESAILQDLRMLGLADQELSVFDHNPCDFRQSNCDHLYKKALDRLSSHGAHVYACDCSRKDILKRTAQQGGEIRYDGYCRDRGLAYSPDKGIRVQMPEGHVPFDDLFAGRQYQHPAAETGDLLLKDRLGQWTYHFAVVVDDLRHGVNLIIRGKDLLPSTGRQLLLANMLTQSESVPFEYFHHPLITDPEGRKLSKRDFDTDIHHLLQKGESPASLFSSALSMLKIS